MAQLETYQNIMLQVWLLCFPGPEVIKLFSYSTQLSTKFILLINVKMPTILRFMSRINLTDYKARNFFFCPNFSF